MGATTAQAVAWDLDGTADTPVLIFELDAAGVPEASAPAHRAQVRLVGTVREGATQFSDARQVSAVLVLRDLTPSRLLSCVRAVTRGAITLPPEVLCQMLPTPARNGPGVQTALTARELDVLRRLADGETTREIAEGLNYSERTVKNIVHDLLEKTNSRTRAQAVALAARQGVI